MATQTLERTYSEEIQGPGPSDEDATVGGADAEEPTED